MGLSAQESHESDFEQTERRLSSWCHTDCAAGGRAASPKVLAVGESWEGEPRGGGGGSAGTERIYLGDGERVSKSGVTVLPEENRDPGRIDSGCGELSRATGRGT
jgi:hypothetical protein